jgi:hypothetical protein
MAYDCNSDDGFLGGLRAAGPARAPLAGVSAGPFDVSGDDAATGMSVSDALITGLLVAYPVLATVVALIVGISLSGPVV